MLAVHQAGRVTAINVTAQTAQRFCPSPAAVLALAETDRRRNSSQVTAAKKEISHQMSRAGQKKTKREGEQRRKRKLIKRENSARADSLHFVVKGCSCGNLILKAANTASQVLPVTHETTFPHFCCLSLHKVPQKKHFFDKELFLALNVSSLMCGATSQRFLLVFTDMAFQEFQRICFTS